MKRFVLPAIGLGGLAAVGLLLAFAPRAGGAANTACPAGVGGTLANLGRSIVPIAYATTRTVTVNKGGQQLTITNLRVTAPGAVPVADKAGFGLRITATEGPYEVQGTWTVGYTDEQGAPRTCDAAGALTLNAAKGSPLTLYRPTWSRHLNPAVWRWACEPDSDPVPRALTIKWEVDPRGLPLGAKGGNPPFRFRFHPKTIRLTTGDPCDARQSAGFTRKRLEPQGKLSVSLGRLKGRTLGALSVRYTGIIRNEKSGSFNSVRLQITLKAGARVLEDVKVCTWDAFYMTLAKGKGVLCWR
jgi:hypothetical protein